MIVVKTKKGVQKIDLKNVKRYKQEVEEVLKDEKLLEESLYEFIKSMPFDKVYTFTGEVTKEELLKEIEHKTEKYRHMLEVYRKMLEEMVHG
ncbi:MAG: hypothetical protein QW794_03215 [Thermosphaera sp.]